jgi:hypothetical protein
MILRNQCTSNGPVDRHPYPPPDAPPQGERLSFVMQSNNESEIVLDPPWHDFDATPEISRPEAQPGITQMGEVRSSPWHRRFAGNTGCVRYSAQVANSSELVVFGFTIA